MSPGSRQTVLLAGAGGRTGSSIAKALTKRPEKFLVKAIVREESLQKPIVGELRELGVEIVKGDIVEDKPEALQEYLKDVDTVIITTIPHQPDQQNKFLLATKEAHVKRVIPSDFGPYAPPGSMWFQDTKIATHELIKKHNIPYTFIQVGWWASLTLPLSHKSTTSVLKREFYGSGDVKTAYTDTSRIGEFIARIIDDPRTLNQTVQAWDGETTLSEAWKIASKVSGETFDDYLKLSAEEIESKIGTDLMSTVIYEYARSLWIRGDNTVENAVKAGALDARVLYPDYVPGSLEEYAAEFYRQDPFGA
ncbi:hypothetical protein AAF712_007372 [Marasmius tenuissimus]|uniref:NmrA-like domain-containing protein n=1 Tax=Marasmius tenuissimus TaxID=585030 RepID=A0ABR2ZWZ3_9AGAR